MATGSSPSQIGRYVVDRRVGRGGMGVVYRATDPQIGRTVAIKLMHDVDDEARPRFLREVRLLGTLNHANIVTIFDSGEHGEQPYFVMEFVEGRTLADIVRNQTMSLAQRIEIGRQLCSALDYAHERGVIHRDVKPTNLMVTSAGSLKVLDFGIARAIDSTASRVGSIVGTVNYMAPEQLAGQEVDRRADVFAVGVVLYELFSSMQAFPGDTPMPIMNAVLNREPAPLTAVCPGLDPALERIVNRAIQKDPAARYQTLASLAADLAEVATGAGASASAPAATGIQNPTQIGTTVRETVASSSSGDRNHVPPIATRSRGPWPAIAVACILVAAVSLGFLWSRFNGVGPDTRTVVEQPPPPPPTPQPIDIDKDGGPTDSPDASGTRRGLPPPPRGEGRGSKVDGRGTDPGGGRGKPPENPVTVAEHACDGGSAAACLDLGVMYEQGNGVVRDLARAGTLFKRACDANVGRGCHRLARMTRDGFGVVKNGSEAVRLFERACDLGTMEGCNDLGAALRLGTSVARDEARAAVFFGKACDAGLPIGCANLGRALREGRGVPKDVVRARSILQKACDAGDLSGCSELGILLIQGLGGPADAAGAVALFTRVCDGKNQQGCNQLGIAYARGDGVARDDNKAAELYRTACEGGIPAACFNLGRRYLDGLGAPRDFAQAAGFFQRACDGPYLPGCVELGVRYARGEGVTRDDAKAAELFKRACDGGVAAGCANLAHRYITGLGVARDPVRGIALLRQACEGQFYVSCNELGMRYRRGDDVVRDPAQALIFFQRACDGALPMGCTNLADQKGLMDGRGAGPANRSGGGVGGVTGGIPAGAGGVSAPPPPPSAPPPPVRVSGVNAPKQTKHVKPVYPAVAQSARIQGVVTVEAVIGVDGKVRSARILRSVNQMLNDAALAAVRQWEYTPTIIGGRAVPVIMAVVVNFQLN